MLVGLQSFAEGLDLKGDLLSQVHIHKIAFPPIDSPVVITEGEWLKSLNRYPFEVQSLPSASFNLIQAGWATDSKPRLLGRSGYLRQTLADQKLWQATTGCITGISDRATGSP
ncbi:ATP-dependent DNA helicase DinG [Escherichia coli]|uniref:ATP-dependent DNA helicase DinG n=1 Tax=Escherichia coli TaxID=562 RepID=A0A376TII6_ECOLX|nr:ATP-dependent DNA helicase DinG [Escherichia coli]